MGNKKYDTHMLNIVVSKWALETIKIIQQQTLRFGEIQKALPQTTQKVLAETLHKLERNGIVDRRVYPTVPLQVEYKLTAIGLDLLKLSSIISNWIDTHEEEIKRAQKSYDRRKKL